VNEQARKIENLQQVFKAGLKKSQNEQVEQVEQHKTLVEKFGGLPKFKEFVEKLIKSMNASQLKYGDIAVRLGE
jgi:hypothetical protein